MSLVTDLYGLSDALRMRLRVSGNPAVKIRGEVAGMVELGSLKFAFPMTVESSAVSLDGQEICLLLRGKGDLCMLAVAELGPKLLSLTILDRSKLKDVKSTYDLFERRQVIELGDVLKIVKPGVVTTFRRPRYGAEWLQDADCVVGG